MTEKDHAQQMFLTLESLNQKVQAMEEKMEDQAHKIRALHESLDSAQEKMQEIVLDSNTIKNQMARRAEYMVEFAQTYQKLSIQVEQIAKLYPEAYTIPEIERLYFQKNKSKTRAAILNLDKFTGILYWIGYLLKTLTLQGHTSLKTWPLVDEKHTIKKEDLYLQYTHWADTVEQGRPLSPLVCLPPAYARVAALNHFGRYLAEFGIRSYQVWEGSKKVNRYRLPSMLELHFHYGVNLHIVRERLVARFLLEGDAGAQGRVEQLLSNHPLEAQATFPGLDWANAVKLREIED